MAEEKLNASLFDKLTANERITAIIDDGRTDVAAPDVTQLRFASADRIDRFNEAAMRASIRRELNWLLNTVHLAAAQDLTAYPQVSTSVLNYGVPDLTGRISTPNAVQARANEIRLALRTFEPRLEAERLTVEVKMGVDMDNAVNFVIRGDITSAVKAMPVQFFASVEVETGEAVIRE